MTAQPFPLLRSCLGAAALLLTTGCTPWQSAAYESTRFALQPAAAVDKAQLRPELRYLRVTTQGTPVLLVLGEIDRDAQGREVQVWYSAGAEVLRLQNGRLVGLTGTPVEWRHVALPASLPAWSSIAAPTTYVRTLDRMPGYHIGLREQVTVRPIAAPGSTQLQGVDEQRLRWFEETARPSTDTPAAISARIAQLPPSRYAVFVGANNQTTPVYGEQCLDAQTCFQWQSWPPRLPEN